MMQQQAIQISKTQKRFTSHYSVFVFVMFLHLAFCSYEYAPHVIPLYQDEQFLGGYFSEIPVNMYSLFMYYTASLLSPCFKLNELMLRLAPM